MLMGKQKGVGLIELMVSITIGMMILAGVVQLYLTSVESQRSQEGLSRIQENMRYLSSRLSIEVGTSGFLGCVPRIEGDYNRVFNFLTEGAGSESDGSPQPYNFRDASISGSNNDGVNGSDSVSFRFATAKSIPLKQEELNMTTGKMTLDNTGVYDLTYRSLQQFQVAIISNCNYGHVFMITNEPGDDGVVEFEEGKEADDGPNTGQSNTFHSLGPVYYGADSTGGASQTRANLFIIGTGGYTYDLRLSERGQVEGGTCDDDSPQYCALFMNGEELMEGISDFQVDYGWTSGSTVTYGDSKAVSDAGGWARVDRVRMNVTVSAIESTGSNEKGQLGRINRTFSQVIILRNTVVEA